MTRPSTGRALIDLPVATGRLPLSTSPQVIFVSWLLRSFTGSADPPPLLLFAITGSAELPEALPRHETAHAALLTDILDAVHGSSPAAKGQRPSPKPTSSAPPS